MLLPFLDQSIVWNLYNCDLYPSTAFYPGTYAIDIANTTASSQVIATYVCPSAYRVPQAGGVMQPHNYSGIGSSHGYGGCGRHGSDLGNGVFAFRWGIIDDDGTSPPVFVARTLLLRDIESKAGSSKTLVFTETAQGRPTLYSSSLSSTSAAAMDAGRSWADPYYNSNVVSCHPNATPNGLVPTYISGSGARFAWNNPKSYHEGGVHGLFMDGKAQFFTDAIDKRTWNALCTVMKDDNPGNF